MIKMLTVIIAFTYLLELLPFVQAGDLLYNLQHKDHRKPMGAVAAVELPPRKLHGDFFIPPYTEPQELCSSGKCVQCERDIDFVSTKGIIASTVKVLDVAACCDACRSDRTCWAWVFQPALGKCYLKSDEAVRRPNVQPFPLHIVSGVVRGREWPWQCSPMFNNLADGTAGAPRSTHAAVETNDVTLTVRFREDCLGSFLQVGVAAMTMAQHKHWAFCAPSGVLHSEWFEKTGFPCTADIMEGPKTLLPWNLDDVRAPGVYEAPQHHHVDHTNVGLWDAVQRMEEAKPCSAWNAQHAFALKEQLQDAIPNVGSSLANTGGLTAIRVTIALHVRRGDIGPGNMRWIADETFLSLLRLTKAELACDDVSEGRCDVHLFSEEENPHGDWTLYTADSLVDHMHLAAHHSDLDSALHDWRNFIDADVLIVGSTFSAVPALARSSSVLTLYALTQHGYFDMSRFVPQWWLGWKTNADLSVSVDWTTVQWNLDAFRKGTRKRNIANLILEDLDEAEIILFGEEGKNSAKVTTPSLRGRSPASSDRLLCVAIVKPTNQPGDKELELLYMQREHRLGIFACTKAVVLSNTDVLPLPKSGDATEPIKALKMTDSSMDVAYGGEWHSALNAPLFAEIWRNFLTQSNMQTLGEWDWLVKVDVDTVFIPHRLVSLIAAGRKRLGSKAYDGSLVLLHNRLHHVQLHGALEIMSRQATNVFRDGLHLCVNDDAPKQEDLWLYVCLRSLPGVAMVVESDLIVEPGSGGSVKPPRPPLCQRGTPRTVAFHPAKSIDKWTTCLHDMHERADVAG